MVFLYIISVIAANIVLRYIAYHFDFYVPIQGIPNSKILTKKKTIYKLEPIPNGDKYNDGVLRIKNPGVGGWYIIKYKQKWVNFLRLRTTDTFAKLILWLVLPFFFKLVHLKYVQVGSYFLDNDEGTRIMNDENLNFRAYAKSLFKQKPTELTGINKLNAEFNDSFDG